MFGMSLEVAQCYLQTCVRALLWRQVIPNRYKISLLPGSSARSRNECCRQRYEVNGLFRNKLNYFLQLRVNWIPSVSF
jgi:hypothetical protein